MKGMAYCDSSFFVGFIFTLVGYFTRMIELFPGGQLQISHKRYVSIFNQQSSRADSVRLYKFGYGLMNAFDKFEISP